MRVESLKHNDDLEVLQDDEKIDDLDSITSFDVNLGAFVKVKLASKHRVQLFAAQVTNIQPNLSGYEIRYLKKSENNKHVFTDEDPEAKFFLDPSHILELRISNCWNLEVPTIDNRGRYHFKNEVHL